jgi:hypothetical protein
MHQEFDHQQNFISHILFKSQCTTAHLGDTTLLKLDATLRTAEIRRLGQNHHPQVAQIPGINKYL